MPKTQCCVLIGNMPHTPEDRARENIDRLLHMAGWTIVNRQNAAINAAPGVIIRQFPMNDGGIADYVMYIGGKAAGKSLSGSKSQAAKYINGLPPNLPAWARPLPFYYISSGEESRFYNGLSAAAQERTIFAFHTPQALLQLLESAATGGFMRRVGNMPKLKTENLWAAQAEAVQNLEKSLARGHRRALIQMATGSGKTYTAINFIYRLIKHAGARRVLFLVDRTNLGEQTESEFKQFMSPDENIKFHEEYTVQRLTSNEIPPDSTRVCISTIQRLYAMLCGRELESTKS